MYVALLLGEMEDSYDRIFTLDIPYGATASAQQAPCT